MGKKKAGNEVEEDVPNESIEDKSVMLTPKEKKRARVTFDEESPGLVDESEDRSNRRAKKEDKRRRTDSRDEQPVPVPDPPKRKQANADKLREKVSEEARASHYRVTKAIRLAEDLFFDLKLTKKERVRVLRLLLVESGMIACTALPAQMASLNLKEKTASQPSSPKGKNPKTKKGKKPKVAKPPTASPFTVAQRTEISALKARVNELTAQENSAENLALIRDLRSQIKAVKRPV